MTTADVSPPPLTPPPAQPSSNHLWQQYALANIYRCLSPCKECTGNYVSEMLQKRFICHCICHKTIEDNFAFTIPRIREADI
jgi:hypothetical protein